MAHSSGDRLQRYVGESVKRLRIKRGITQEEAAHRAAIDYKRWQKIEAGKGNLTLRSLDRIAQALGVKVRDLF